MGYAVDYEESPKFSRLRTRLCMIELLPAPGCLHSPNVDG